MPDSNPAHHGTVDIGSNGIRTSIVTLSPHPRLFRTVYANRIPVSLHDAQYNQSSNASASATRQSIPSTTISTLVAALRSFQRTCADFHVPGENVHVVATEAMRTAPNAADLISEIKCSLQWDIQLLSQGEEAEMGALGIAMSVPAVQGLCLDLGGGSLQLTCVDTRKKPARPAETQTWWEKVKGRGLSLPFGAAALSRRLAAAGKEHAKIKELRQEITMGLRQAVKGTGILKRHGDLQELALYVSGGGFRGWGYLLMALRENYPIPWINGFSASAHDFFDVESVEKFVNSATTSGKGKAKPGKIFGVSKRRLQQLPAIRLVVQCLAEALQGMKVGDVTFCQGGTPLGILFSQLSSEDRVALSHGEAMQLACTPEPIQSFHRVHIQPWSHSPGIVSIDSGNGTLVDILLDSVPTTQALTDVPHPHVLSSIPALALNVNTHQHVIRDIRASTALRFPISSEFGSTLGITHFERAALAIMLVERWGGKKELPPTDLSTWQALCDIVGEAVWWCRYLGRAAAILGLVYPAARTVAESVPDRPSELPRGSSDDGLAGPGEEAAPAPERMSFRKASEDGLHVCVDIDEPYLTDEVRDAVKKWEKLINKRPRMGISCELKAALRGSLRQGRETTVQG
ncbi:MAG: hypothetical protein Q9162_005214 [Coniocarpon cinnabarinum]